MNYLQLVGHIIKKKSFLCVGLDTDIRLIPSHLLKKADPVFEFNKQIIDATAPFAIAYKPNIAFYECLGASGWKSLNLTVEYLHNKYPDMFLIADAKRGDIGNTSKMYAETFFKQMNFDAVTVSPYMGSDSVEPFLEFDDKWVIILALTSNEGSNDFQLLQTGHPERLYESVVRISSRWAEKENIMYVVGATRASMILTVRSIVPDHFLLIPGIGAQGGSLDDVCKYGLNENFGLLVNSSRGIIYADKSEKFAETAALKAEELQKQMSVHIKKLRKV